MNILEGKGEDRRKPRTAMRAQICLALLCLFPWLYQDGPWIPPAIRRNSRLRGWTCSYSVILAKKHGAAFFCRLTCPVPCMNPVCSFTTSIFTTPQWQREGCSHSPIQRPLSGQHRWILTVTVGIHQYQLPTSHTCRPCKNPRHTGKVDCMKTHSWEGGEEPHTRFPYVSPREIS